MKNTVIVSDIKKCWTFNNKNTGDPAKTCKVEFTNLKTGNTSTGTIKFNDPSTLFPRYRRKKCDPKKDKNCKINLVDLL
jgi:hypothetical protein